MAEVEELVYCANAGCPLIKGLDNVVREDFASDGEGSGFLITKALPSVVVSFKALVSLRRSGVSGSTVGMKRLACSLVRLKRVPSVDESGRV